MKIKIAIIIIILLSTFLGIKVVTAQTEQRYTTVNLSANNSYIGFNESLALGSPPKFYAIGGFPDDKTNVFIWVPIFTGDNSTVLYIPAYK